MGEDSCKNVIPIGILPGHSGSDAPLHWYVAYAGEGREDACAAQCQKLLVPHAAEACFVPKREHLMKRQGAWRLVEVPLFKGYIVLAACDARTLALALGKLSVRAELVGKHDAACAPLPADVKHWLEGALDDAHVLRASEGVIEDGNIVVTHGPLAGREGCIAKIDRHKRLALVGLGKGSEAFLIKAALSVPVKSPAASAGAFRNCNA